MAIEQTLMGRRDFFVSLAASFVAAQGITKLPYGFPSQFPYVTYTQREFLLPIIDAWESSQKIVVHIAQWHSEFGVTNIVEKVEKYGVDIRTGEERIEYD